MSLRLAGRYGERGKGFGDNPIRGVDAARIDHDIAARGTLNWEPSAIPMTVSLSADYANIKDTYNNVALRGINPTGPALALYSGQFDIASFLQSKSRFYRTYNDPNTGNANIDTPYNYNKTWGVRATIEYDLGDVKIKSITAYREADTGDGTDLDGTPAKIASYASDYSQKQRSEELQFSGNLGKLEFIFGGFYFKEMGDEQSQSLVFQDTDFGFNLAPANTNLATYKSESKALFAQVNYSLTERLRATGGFRYTWDKRSINRMGYIGEFQVFLVRFSPTANWSHCPLRDYAPWGLMRIWSPPVPIALIPSLPNLIIPPGSPASTMSWATASSSMQRRVAPHWLAVSIRARPRPTPVPSRRKR